jgi:glycosyltransferase involved in cell wall biosynthesis
MRILMLDQSGELGGAEFAMMELCERAAFEWRAVLFADGPFRQKLETLGRKVDVVSSSSVDRARRDSPFSIRTIFEIAIGLTSMVRNISKQAAAFDMIYANTQKAMVIGALAGFFARRPVVWYLHDIVTYEHFGRGQRLVVKWFSKTLLAEVVCNSEASRAAFSALTGIAWDRLPIIYNGIPAEPFFHIADESKQALRERFHLPSDAFLVGCFSRLAPWKGQHVLLEAVAKDTDAHAVLVGAPLFCEHAYAQALHQQVKALGIEDRVHFLGFQSDIPRAMRAMDVIVHASTAPEPFGRVIVEGMLAERPVIGTRAGGVTEIIDDGKTGLLVPPGDAQALYDAIASLQANPPLASRLARAGTEKALAEFTPEEHCRRMSDVLSRNVRRGERGH